MNFKKIGIRFGCFSLAAVCFGAAGNYLKMNEKPVSAAVLQTDAFAEDFSDKNTSAQWAKNDFSFAGDSYYSLRMDRHSTYGAVLAYTDYEVDGSCEIRFDMRYTETAKSASGDWFGVMFGLTEESNHFVYSTAVVNCKKTLVQLMDDGDGEMDKIVATSYDEHKKFADSFVGAAAKEKVTVSLSLAYTGKRAHDNANLYRIDGYYYSVGGTKPISSSFYYEDVACDGWFGFSGMSNSIVDISDLRVYESGELVSQEDFKSESGEGIRFVGSKADENWRAFSFAEAKLYSYYNGSISADKPNGILLSKTALEVDTRCETPLTFRMETTVNGLPAGSSFGVAFGVSETAGNLSDGTFIGLQGEEGGGFTVVYKKSGELIKQTETLSLALLKKDGKAVLEFSSHYDGSGVFSVNGYTVAFDDVNVVGYFAIGTQGTVAPDLHFDNVEIVERKYAVANTANKSIDFSGLKESVEEDYTYVERYINEREWFIGANVSLPKIYREKEKYIQFVNSSTGSFFGPKAIYSEFICRFTITVIQNRAETNENTSIGLSFGKEARNDLATDCPTVAFVKTAGGMALKGYHCSLLGGDGASSWNQYEAYPELDFWSSENWEKSPVTYRVMIVVRGGKAYVYYANAESDTSEMSKLKAVFYGMETYGCVTLSAWGGASFRLRDFAITNIAV